MPSHRIVARRPRGEPAAPEAVTDPDRLHSFLEDAAHVPGGHTPGLMVATTEAEVAGAIVASTTVLPIGAQSSLTGGATPRGETIVSTARLNRVIASGDDWVRVGAGMPLVDLDAALAKAGKYYPPAPTFAGAFVGGTVATNAAGAATFKYGTTRDWVRALTVVLPTGDVLDIERGATQADEAGGFEVVLRDRTVRVPVPRYRLPKVPKVSAGYYAAADMDLIDLFIGAEGTLGIVTEVTLRVRPNRPEWCLAFVPFAARAAMLRFVGVLRGAARQTWHTQDPRGLDVSAIEYLDARSLGVAREDGADRRTGVTWSDGTRAALLVTIECAASMTSQQAFEEIGRAGEPGAPDTPLCRFCHMLDRAGVLDEVQIAVPGDAARIAQLLALREAVPAGVNSRVGLAQATVDRRIEKTAADMIVPFERLDDLLGLYESAFSRRGLDVAIWGHVSDGNLHPNVIPASFADVESGRAAILDLGRDVIRMGGSPLAEHGVGRNLVKQQLLVELYGRDGIDQMRAVKRALDPEWKLAPGILFSRA
jgi:D-lactate dehydrogenase (cytochrome)